MKKTTKFLAPYPYLLFQSLILYFQLTPRCPHLGLLEHLQFSMLTVEIPFPWKPASLWMALFSSHRVWNLGVFSNFSSFIVPVANKWSNHMGSNSLIFCNWCSLVRSLCPDCPNHETLFSDAFCPFISPFNVLLSECPSCDHVLFMLPACSASLRCS